MDDTANDEEDVSILSDDEEDDDESVRSVDSEGDMGFFDSVRFSQTVFQIYNNLVRDGHNGNDIVRVAAARATLENATEKLKRLKRNPPRNRECQIMISSSDPSSLLNPDNLRLNEHERLLLPDVKRFAEILPSCQASDFRIFLGICHIELGREVRATISQALGAAPIETLLVEENDLGREGFAFIVDTLKMNTKVENLVIKNNPMDRVIARSLSRTLSNHPSLKILFFIKCNLGDRAVLSAIMPTFENLGGITLTDNDIGDKEVAIIATALAQVTSELELLCLEDNNIGDQGAVLLSKSLQTNTKLRILRLKGNNIKEPGKLALAIAILNASSLAAAHESNHICSIDTIDGDFNYNHNVYNNAALNKQVKMMQLLRSHIKYVVDIPVTLMPRIIDFIQGKTLKSTPVQYWGLTGVFNFMRQWNLPLLYSHISGKPKLRKKKRVPRGVPRVALFLPTKSTRQATEQGDTTKEVKSAKARRYSKQRLERLATPLKRHLCRKEENKSSDCDKSGKPKKRWVL